MNWCTKRDKIFYCVMAVALIVLIVMYFSFPAESAELNFNIKNFWVGDILGVEVWITETMVNTWIIMGVLIAFAALVRVKLERFTEVPKGLQNVVEAVVEIFENFVIGTAGKRLSYLGNWFFMVFVFIFLSNISGLLGMRPPTADWATTLAFALVTFGLIQAMGWKYRRGEYIKSFFEPNFVFFPLNVVGELARPISLSFRLFGNILSGVILTTMIYTLPPVFARFILPIPLHGFFDLIIGFLQTYIFSVLSLSFIAGASGIESEAD